jgi:hypothetical protein
MKAELFERVREIPGAVVSEGAFAPGDAVWVGRREIAHVDADGALDVRLTKAVIRARREEFRSDPRIRLRAGPSDWIEVSVVSPEDIDFAVDLVKEAIAANVSTAQAGAPPTGTELERRRRFH